MKEDYAVEDRRVFDDDGNTKTDLSEIESGSGGNPRKVEEEPSMVQKILLGDILGKFINAGLVPTKYRVSREGKITINEKNAEIAHETPWYFTHNSADRDCGIAMDIAQIFQMVPRKCRSCWKVVVYPNSLKELFMLKKLQEQMVRDDPFCLCKCGIEPRSEVERNYGGYFYNDSIEEGLIKLRRVRHLVSEHISPDVKVILKRGCTEFERAFGSSSKWDELFGTEYHKVLERKLDDVLYIKPQEHRQTDLIRHHVMAKWILFAAERGDPTVAELNNGENLYPDYETYEEDTVVFKEESDEEGNKE